MSAFARVQEDPDRFSSYLLRSVKALFLMALPVCWGMSVIAEELIPLFLGSKWEDATMPFKVLALIMPLRILSPFINSANFGTYWVVRWALFLFWRSRADGAVFYVRRNTNCRIGFVEHWPLTARPCSRQMRGGRSG